jgi:hypothetical protein
MTVLLITFAAVGWVIVSSVGANTLSQQRSTAAGLIEQRDSALQVSAPTCANAANLASTTTKAVQLGTGTTTTTYTIITATGTVANNLIPITITVQWPAKFPNQQTAQLVNSVQIQCA